MKRHTQLPGIRKWSGDDLIELQSETLAVLDQFFGHYGDMVITGCVVNKAAKTISSGLVALTGKDHEGKDTFKVCPFAGATGVEVFPVYLALKYTEITRDYEDAAVKPIARHYEAEMLKVLPAGRAYLTLSETTPRFTDKIQDASHRFVTDEDKTKWNGVAGKKFATGDEEGKALDSKKLEGKDIDGIMGTTVTFSESETLANIATKDSIKVVFGKLSKWWTDKIGKLKDLAFKDQADWKTDISNRPLPTYKSKSITQAAWIASGDASKPAYKTTINDADIMDGMDIEYSPADMASENIYGEAKVYSFLDAKAGSFTIYADNIPSGTINMNFKLGKL